MGINIYKKTDLDKVLEYVNNSADKARDLMFEETSNTASHVTTIITCEQIAKFIKKLQEKNKENDWNTYLYGNNN
jgi:hypothetical protein